MKKVIILLLISLGGFIFLIPQDSSASEIRSQTSYETRFLVRKEIDKENPEGNSLWIHIEYPEITAQFLTKEKKEQVDKAIEDFIYAMPLGGSFRKAQKQTSVKESERQVPDDFPYAGVAIEVGFDVVTLSDRLLSIKFTEHYTPDHHTYVLDYGFGFNYDLQAMQLLSWKDLFQANSDWLPQVIRVTKDALIDQKNQFFSKPEVEELTLDENYLPEFVLAKDQMRLYFSEDYIVGRNATGIIDLHVPYESFKGFKEFFPKLQTEFESK